MGAGKPKRMSAGNPTTPGPNDDVNVEEAAAAAASYGYLTKWTFPNGNVPGPRLGNILKKLTTDKACAVPWFAEKAEELGLDPEETTIGAVFAMSMMQAAIKNPSSPSGRELLNRVDGIMKGTMEVTNLKTVKHQVALGDLPDDVLNALLDHAKVINGNDDDDDDGSSGAPAMRSPPLPRPRVDNEDQRNEVEEDFEGDNPLARRERA